MHECKACTGKSNPAKKKSMSSPALQFIFVFVHATGWPVTSNDTTSTEHSNRDTFSFYILQQRSPMTSLFANMACTTLAWSFWALSMADLDHGELKYNVSTIQNKTKRMKRLPHAKLNQYQLRHNLMQKHEMCQQKRTTSKGNEWLAKHSSDLSRQILKKQCALSQTTHDITWSKKRGFKKK